MRQPALRRNALLLRATHACAAVVLAIAMASCGDDDGAAPAGEAPLEAPAIAGELGLASEVVLAGLAQPTDFAFAPDRRMFIATKDGSVLIARDGEALAEPFVRVPANDYHERGLLGLALDPDFAANGYVYLYFVHDAAFYDEDFDPRTARLVRVTADGDRAITGSETVLLGGAAGDAEHPTCAGLPIEADCLPADGLSHIGGALGFASDGTLYVGVGEGSFLTDDPEETRARAQQLDSLGGKILRINADGSAPTDNPFFTGDPLANRSKVWAYGLRNPFRLDVQPETDLPFVGDVGSAFWEEINVARPGANFGWPCHEGPEINEVHAQLPFCEAFLETAPAVADPLYAYEVAFLVGSAVVGGVFYEGSAYPPEVQGAYVFGDWVEGSVSALRVDADGRLIESSVLQLLAEAGQPVDFEIGPDGDVYYLTLDLATGMGDVRHITYDGG